MLLALVLLLQLRIRLLLLCGADGIVLRAGFGPFRVSLYPRRKKETRKKVKKRIKMAKKKIEETPKDAPPDGPPLGLMLDLAMELLSVALEAAGRFRRKLLIAELFIHINWGARNPADAAIGYGMANAALGAILALLEANFRVKKTDTLVNLDYSLEKPNVYLRANLSLSLLQALSLGIFAGQKSLSAYMSYRKAKKLEIMTRKAVR